MRIVHIDTGREMRGGQRQVLLLARGLRERGHEQVILARRGGSLFEACRAAGFDTRPLSPAMAGAQIVHAHDARAHVLGLAAPRLVVSRRVAFPIGSGIVSRWKYRRAARYLAVSEFVKGQLVAAGVAPASADPQKGAALAEEACRSAGIELCLSDNLERDLPRAGLFLYLTYRHFMPVNSRTLWVSIRST